MSPRIVVLGASASGIVALRSIVSELPPDLDAAVLVVQHVPATSPSVLPAILSRSGPLPAVHPLDGERIVPGRIYVAPPDRHLVIGDGTIELSHGPKENHWRPSVDVLFRSAAVAYGPAVIGVVLTGYLDDGTAGLLSIKDRGGVAIVQDPADAAAASMPQSALDHVVVDHCVPASAIGPLIARLVAAHAQPADPPPTALTEIEVRLARGTPSLHDWSLFARHAVACGMTCPLCGASLHEVADTRVLRFRCRAGHALAAASLASAQQEAREQRTAQLFAALHEEALLARRVAELRGRGAPGGTGARHLARAARIESHAAELAAWMRETVDVVDPDRPPAVEGARPAHAAAGESSATR